MRIFRFDLNKNRSVRDLSLDELTFLELPSIDGYIEYKVNDVKHYITLKRAKEVYPNSERVDGFLPSTLYLSQTKPLFGKVTYLNASKIGGELVTYKATPTRPRLKRFNPKHKINSREYMVNGYIFNTEIDSSGEYLEGSNVWLDKRNLCVTAIEFPGLSYTIKTTLNDSVINSNDGFVNNVTVGVTDWKEDLKPLVVVAGSIMYDGLNIDSGNRSLVLDIIVSKILHVHSYLKDLYGLGDNLSTEDKVQELLNLPNSFVLWLPVKSLTIQKEYFRIRGDTVNKHPLEDKDVALLRSGYGRVLDYRLVDGQALKMLDDELVHWFSEKHGLTNLGVPINDAIAIIESINIIFEHKPIH